MPKIPTFTSTGRVTAEPTGVISNSNISLSQTIGAAVEPLVDFAAKAYVKEKKLEADNKAYSLLSDMYIDQKDSSGKVIQKGLFTIQSETSGNGEPTIAAEYNDVETNKLYNYFKNNKFDGVDNYTKKIIASKFFSTAGILKTKSLEGSRNEQIRYSKDVDEDYISKEALTLKEIGSIYLPIYNQKVKDRITANTTYDEGQKKILIEAYTKFGSLTLADSLLSSNPKKLNELLKTDFFDNIDLENKLELSAKADKAIFDINVKQISFGLEYIPGMEMKELYANFKEIRDGAFLNKNQQNIWNNFSQIEKQEALKTSISKLRESEFLYKQYNQDIDRKAADASQEAYDSLLKNTNGDTYDVNTINQIYSDNSPIKLDLLKINEMVETDEIIPDSSYNKKIDILQKISMGEIIDIQKQFKLPNESEPSSLIQRVINRELSKKDLEKFNTLFKPNGVDDGTKNNMNKFFNFIEDTQIFIAGMPSFKFFDANYDKRLNFYTDTMYERFLVGLSEGKMAEDLLDNTNESYIAKDGIKFQPNREDIVRQAIIFKKKMQGYDKRLDGETIEEYNLRISGK
jgi:hypothetical protein